MKLFEQETYEATNEWRRIGCITAIVVSILLWLILISFIKWCISEPFSETKKVRQVVAIEDTPRLVINTPVQAAEPKYLDIPLSHELQDYIESEVKNYPFVTKELALAVMKKESDFDNSKIGQANEVGFMQIHPINFGWLSEQGLNVYDPYQNIKSGLIMLNYLIGKQSDIEMGLMCYNQGESDANDDFEKGKFESKYSSEVMKIKSEMEMNK